MASRLTQSQKQTQQDPRGAGLSHPFLLVPSRTHQARKPRRPSCFLASARPFLLLPQVFAPMTLFRETYCDVVSYKKEYAFGFCPLFWQRAPKALRMRKRKVSLVTLRKWLGKHRFAGERGQWNLHRGCSPWRKGTKVAHRGIWGCLVPCM